MSLENLKIRTYKDSVAALPDYPSDAGYSAAQLKAIFDGRTDKEIKEKFNALIDELVTRFGQVEVDIADEVEAHNGISDAHQGLFSTIHERIAEIIGDNISIHIALDEKASSERMDTVETDINIIYGQMNDKVDRVAGKGLSSNDFSDTDKEMLLEVVDHKINFLNPHKVTAEQLGALTADSLNDELGKYIPPLENDIGALWEDKADKTELENYVKNTDYADNSAKYGLVKVAYGYGTQISPDGYLAIVRCSKSEIDERTNSTHPITPDVLEYAVKSVGDGYYATVEQIGDIEAALDELHTYAETLIGGDAE